MNIQELYKTEKKLHKNGRWERLWIHIKKVLNWLFLLSSIILIIGTQIFLVLLLKGF